MTNVTDQQPITPPLVVVHESNAVLVPSSADRLPGLEALAESGAQAELVATLTGRKGIKSVKRFGGIIKPGESATIQNVTAEPGDRDRDRRGCSGIWIWRCVGRWDRGQR